MSETENKAPAPEYWTTLSEYYQDADYKARVGEEFYPEAKPDKFFEAAEEPEKMLGPMQRRTFLKLSGFAALASTLSACERPVQKVLPYVNKPEEITPGVANYYASVLGGPDGSGLLIKTREGRPIKLEGNPDHPLTSGGALDTRGQAEILSLYDPDRLKWPVSVRRQGDAEGNPEQRLDFFDKTIGEKLARASGKVVLLTPTIHGQAHERLLADFGKIVPNFEHVTYDPLQDGMVRDAHEACFGEAVTPQYHFDKARTIVCFGGDPLGQGYSIVQTQGQFGHAHHPERPEEMARLYTFDPVPTLTAMKADYRYQVNPTTLLSIALGIANAVIIQRRDQIKNTALANDPAIQELLARYSLEEAAAHAGAELDELERLADDLVRNQGQGLLYANGANARTEDGYALHLVTNLLNAALGNYGQTLDISAAPSHQVQSSHANILRLTEEMKNGGVETLLFYGINPVYTLPEEAGFAEALGNVDTVISLSPKMDETVALSDMAVPTVHSLEAWGDAEPVRGLHSIQQPAIRPIFGEQSADARHQTRAWAESLIKFAQEAGSDVFHRELTQAEIEDIAQQEGVEPGELTEEQKAPRPINWHEYVKETWEQKIYPKAGDGKPFEQFWMDALQLGFVDLRDNASGDVPSYRTAALQEVKPAGVKDGPVFVALPTTVHGGGESMGIPHLLELPDPLTKISWDNYIMMAPATARGLDVEDGDHVTLTVGDTELTAPARKQPGLHPDVYAVYLGWGRDTQDGIGHLIGVNAYRATRVSNGRLVYSGLPATATPAKGRTELADAQGHNYLYSPQYMGVMVNKRKGEVPEDATRNEQDNPVYSRPIIGETTLDEWKKNDTAGFPNHHGKDHEYLNMWGKKHEYLGHHWGMTVDLNACIGCNACMIACSIENNVPVVGKEELAMGREMFWIRIDRYYRGPEEKPDFVQQPLMCQHCDNAPCETVCPVVATLHNDEGLNTMIYNRCVGTRYCANNCPYKVRRFNFWQYSDYRTGPHEAKELESPLELVLNPDVTTRSRGVMEKCSFCRHRIRVAKDEARMSGRPVQDGEMQTACQQTCPTKAITFGDMNDPNAEVTEQWDNPRSYGLLADLNTDPSVRYQTLVRNREEPSPYRTKYQAHREDHGPGGKDGHGDNGPEHGQPAGPGTHGNSGHEGQ